MNNTPFTIAQMRPIREAMTISRPARLGADSDFLLQRNIFILKCDLL